jgi:hypothetical protein
MSVKYIYVCVCVCTHLLTYLLTYSMVHDILCKADSDSACQTTTFLYGTRRFVTVLTKANHLILSLAESSLPHRSISP